jgi:hypothetical protein
LLPHQRLLHRQRHRHRRRRLLPLTRVRMMSPPRPWKSIMM